MFRSRSKFDNEAPMSRRGARVGLVVTVALAMVAVLASTVGVLSSQSTTPSLTVGSGTYSVAEGEQLTVNLTSSSSEGYDLVLSTVATTSEDFDLAQDITSLVLSPDVGSDTTITAFPQTVSIESGTTMITLTFEVAEDLYVEPNESFTLSAKPGSGTAATTVITLTDPAAVTVGLSVDGATTITEGQTRNINITLSRPLMEFDGLSNRNPQDMASGSLLPSSYKWSSALTGSNFEDISGLPVPSEAMKYVYPGTGSANRDFVRTLGFDFEFFGQVHQEVVVNTNGYVVFTDDAANSVDFKFEDNFGDQRFEGGPEVNELPIAAAFWQDLDIRPSRGADGIYTAIRGTAPNRRFIVQYDDLLHVNYTNVTFQIVLFETTGQIEFRYEDVSNNRNLVAVGITDGSGDDYAQVRIGPHTPTNVVNDDTRIIFTPDINIVTKDAADQEVATYDIIDEIGFSASMGTIAVSPADNSNWDGNQVYTVALDSPTPLVVADATGQVTYTIMDNDSPMVTLERVSGNGPIAEGGSSVELRVRLTNAPSGGAPETLTVNLDVGTASTVDNGDHNLPASVTINQGETEKKFEVTATDDMLAEFNEMLTIEVGALTYGTPVQTVNKLPTPEKIDLTIPLNDTVAVTGITASDTNEGDDVTVMVTLNRALPAGTADDAVKLVLDGTDRINDITDSSWNIANDLRSSATAILMLTLTEDNLLEGNEEITLNLVVDATLDDILPVGDRMSGVTFNILDDEDGTIGFIEPIKTTYNEGESVVLMVGLASGISTASDIVVDYEIDLISAVPGDIVDGGNLTRLATIPTGANAAVITIALTDGNVAEETELFDVLLTDASSSDSAVNARVAITTAASPSVSITILDNEPLEYSFMGSGTVSEDSTDYTVRLRRLGIITENVMLAYTITGIGARATSAADFASGVTGTFVFTGYDAESAEITLTVVDDAVIESTEDFQIALTSRTETHDVTLTDNDQPQVVVEWVSGSTPVAENGMVRLVARLTNGAMSGATEDITVNLAQRAGSTGSAGDVSFPSSVVIARGSLREEFDVDVTDDALAEFNEMVNIYVQNVVTTTLGESSSSDTGYSFEISNNDPIDATVSVVGTTNEGGMARVQITLDRLLPDRTPANVLSLVLLSGGTMNADVRIVSKDITTELESSLTTDVMIELKEDTLLEGNETVQVMLRIEPGMSPDLATLLPDLPSASFEIIDNESGAIGVSPVLSDTEYDEGDSVQFEFSLPTGVTATTDITINYEIIAPPGLVTVSAPGLGTGFAKGLALPVRGLAQAQQPPLSITIPAGQNRVVRTIQLTQDATPEVTEQLTVRILSVSTGPSGPPVEVDPQNRETVITVLDDEPSTYEIIGSGEINEEDGTYTVCLRRLGRVTADEEIPFTIIGPGADEGDFTSPLSGVFKFNGFDPKSEPLTLILDDDNSEEESKPFQISVENPVTKAYASAPIVDPVTGVVFTSITLLDFDVADFLGDLPATGGPVLPVWLLLVLALTGGVALLAPALWFKPRNTRK